MNRLFWIIYYSLISNSRVKLSRNTESNLRHGEHLLYGFIQHKCEVTLQRISHAAIPRHRHILQMQTRKPADHILFQATLLLSSIFVQFNILFLKIYILKFSFSNHPFTPIPYYPNPPFTKEETKLFAVPPFFFSHTQSIELIKSEIRYPYFKRLMTFFFLQ